MPEIVDRNNFRNNLYPTTPFVIDKLIRLWKKRFGRDFWSHLRVSLYSLSSKINSNSSHPLFTLTINNSIPLLQPRCRPPLLFWAHEVYDISLENKWRARSHQCCLKFWKMSKIVIIQPFFVPPGSYETNRSEWAARVRTEYTLYSIQAQVSKSPLGAWTPNQFLYFLPSKDCVQLDIKTHLGDHYATPEKSDNFSSFSIVVLWSRGIIHVAQGHSPLRPGTRTSGMRMPYLDANYALTEM